MAKHETIKHEGPKPRGGRGFMVRTKHLERFNRSGIRFSREPKFVSEEEVTEAIKKEPMLIVEEAKEEGE